MIICFFSPKAKYGKMRLCQKKVAAKSKSYSMRQVKKNPTNKNLLNTEPTA
jgi:hypothetical protein